MAAASVDEAVTSLVLGVLQPPDIDLSLAVVRDAERQDAQIEQQWNLRLERARYDARLAERRYKAVDPDNRPVTRTLEREWNEKLEILASTEREHQSVRRRELVELSDETRARVRALVNDVPRVWSATSTTHEDRKNIVRLMIEAVTLSPIDVPRRMTRVQILWVTGATSEVQIGRPASGPVDISPDTLAALQRMTLEGKADVEIAEELNSQGLVCPTARDGGFEWNESRVRSVRYRRNLARKRGRRIDDHPMVQREDGLFSSYGVAQVLGITTTMVDEWIAQGHLVPTVRGRQTASWFCLDEADRARLCELRDSRATRGYGPGGRARGEADPLNREKQCDG